MSKDMEENFNKQTKEVIDTTDAGNPTTAIKIGNTYPSLRSQALYLEQDVEKIKNEMAEVVNSINFSAGNDNVKFIIDSIYHLIESEITLSKDFDNYFDEQTLHGLSCDVYARVELAKHMIDLLSLSKRLREKEKQIKLTKQNILL